MNLQNFSTYRILPASPPRALARARLSLALSPKCARKLLRSVAGAAAAEVEEEIGPVGPRGNEREEAALLAALVF